jgi:hypothetical protein
MEDTQGLDLLRAAVNHLYDLQRLRIAAGHRADKAIPAILTEEDKTFMHKQCQSLLVIEKEAEREVAAILRKNKVWKHVMKDVKGLGPRMGGLLIAYIDIHRADTPSKIWAFFGLAVDSEGGIQRMKAGQKASFSPWLKSKIVLVLGDCLIKANSPYKDFYNNYKNRKRNTVTDVCRTCKGKKKIQLKDKSWVTCYHCKGQDGPIPWAASDAHLHNAARRYMVKMLLVDIWRDWRELEGLPTRVSYAEEYLGKKHSA